MSVSETHLISSVEFLKLFLKKKQKKLNFKECLYDLI